jgi:DNA-binding NtrC family response regulator
LEEEVHTPAFAPSILVVDDDPAIRHLFARLLTKAGYIVHEVSNGVEAKAALANVTFNLMVLDLNMPEMDGFEVLVFARSAVPNLQTIVVSGFMQGAMLVAARQLGAIATLDKPVDVGLLLSTVRNALGVNFKIETAS